MASRNGGTGTSRCFKCVCDVEICLDNQEECKFKMPFPAEFDCNLIYDPILKIGKMEEFEVDTSAYYK